MLSAAWFFGSLDAPNFITVDKPPASLWVTGLSMRLFDVNCWSALVPQALMGVAAVAVVYATVRRTFIDSNDGAVAGLLAAAALAFTPAAALVFRFNNPDALLVLLLTVAAYGLTRAVQTASWRWLVLVGVVVGGSFLTKMLQGFLVLPAFGLAYVSLAPTSGLKRALHLLGAVVALIAAAGWWVLAVQLVPASARPYIGGSTDNTVVDLALGYNGINSILGRHREGTALADWGGSGAQAFGGHNGLHGLFTGEMGNEISWLILVALFAAAYGMYLAVRGQLSRMELCALVMWGGWLAVTAVTFSYMGGMVRPYYTVALAPSVSALVAIGAVWAWRRRSHWDGRVAVVAVIAFAVPPEVVLLRRNGFGPSWLGWLIGVAAAVAVAGLLWPKPRIAWAVLGMAAALAGTVTFSIATAFTPHQGSIPEAARPSKVTGAWMGDEATIASWPVCSWRPTRGGRPQPTAHSRRLHSK